jgi:BirA family biotin operon repressor/biotin-[acetyl-CoA-carboxylase] ligase
VPGDAAKTALAGTRFADLRSVAETGSTNADLLALARAGAPDGIVLVADHQTAGRGRAGRTWTAPPGASLLFSVLVRPEPVAAPLASLAMAVAAVDAVAAAAGFAPQVKWPNDVVWEGRKLAGILAEAHWPTHDAVAVVVGVGLNVNWPDELPPELEGIATAVNHVAGRPIDREALLVEVLQQFDRRLGDLATGVLLDAWRQRSATLGQRVRVELGSETFEGIARDITDEGHLVVDDRTVTVGDVVHLRPA